MDNSNAYTGNNLIELPSFENLFTNTSAIAPSSSEQVLEIPLSELHPPEFHPFQVNDDEEMDKLADSIKTYGVREPGIVRPRYHNDGSPNGYELLAGNRRKRACELSEIETLPVIIRNLDNDNATITMVDSNLHHREKILPSEKAWAYKVKLEALKHGGIKQDKHSHEILTEQTGESKNQIYRLIRLTELIDPLLNKVDKNELSFNPAVELSYLSVKDQTMVLDLLDMLQIKLSHGQALTLKKLSKTGSLTTDSIKETLFLKKIKMGSLAPANDNILQFKNYFPSDYTQQQMSDIIHSLLSHWQQNQT